MESVQEGKGNRKLYSTKEETTISIRIKPGELDEISTEFFCSSEPLNIKTSKPGDISEPRRSIIVTFLALQTCKKIISV